MSECEACGKPQMASLKFRIVDGKLLYEPCAKGKCEKCGGELKTLSAMVSDDTRHFIKAVECKKCGHTATLKIPRTFEVTLEQMDAYLTSSGWSNKQNHNELTCKYKCLKFPNVYVILPKTEGCLVDETLMMFNALRLIVNVNNDCGIETIVNRIVGIYETEPSSELSGLTNAGDARKANDALKQLNEGACVGC